MNTSPSPLDRPASVPAIRRLLALNALPPEAAQAMERQVRRELPWKLWTDRALLCLGVLLILSSIGYFFAYNWDHLTQSGKLFLAGGAVLASVIGTTWAGVDRFLGKLLLLAASLLVGVFIAVFGQIYQTGADSYELFTAWAILILPWVILGRFVPLWLFWLALVDCAMACYWQVALVPNWWESFTLFRVETASLAAMNLLALVLREVLGKKPIEWMDRGWSTLFLVCAVVIPATVGVIGEIVHSWGVYHASNGGSVLLAFVLYGALTLGLGAYYSRRRYSLPALAVTTFGMCLVLTFLVLRMVLAESSFNEPGIWLFLAVVILGIFGGGVYFLRVQRSIHQL